MNDNIILTEEEARSLRRMLYKLHDLHDEIIETCPFLGYKPVTSEDLGILINNDRVIEVDEGSLSQNPQFKGFEIFVQQVEDLITTLNENTEITSLNFVFFVHLALVFSKESRIDPEVALKAFIKKCKKMNINSQIITCFDNDANIIPEMLKKLTKEMQKTPAYSCEKYLTIGKIDSQEILNFVVPEEKAKKITEYLNEKRLLQEEANRKEEEARLKAKKESGKIEVFEEPPVDAYEYERHSYDAYFNPVRQILKPAVIEYLSFEEFEQLLSQIPIVTKKQKNQYLSAYMDFKTEDEIRKNYASLSMVQKQHLTVGDYEDLKETQIFKVIRALIFTDEYQKMTPEEKMQKFKETIDIYIDRQSDKRSTEKSLLVFSDKDFIANLIDKLSEQRNGYEDADTLKKINTQLEKLKHISIEELRAGGSFHPVMYGDDVVELNGLKGYRFGDKTCKICFFRLSVHNDNKEALKARYNLADTPDVLLIYYVGDVQRVEEEKFYDEANTYVDYYAQSISNISDIFEYPFSTDSEMAAYTLIDMGYSNLEKLENATLDSSRGSSLK